MRHRRLGDRTVSAIGLGAMPMTKPGRDEAGGIATIHAALDVGITFIDTADAYHSVPGAAGLNELLIAAALRSYEGDTSQLVIATKGGSLNPGIPGADWAHCGRADYLKWAAHASARRLGVETIALYQHHRPDPRVDYEESIEALCELLDEGLISMAGISNASTAQISLAHGILGDALVSVQNRFSPTVRESEPQLRLCAELGIAFLPWSPLGGIGNADDLGGAGGRFADVARAHGVSPQQVCLAWELALAPTVIPIPGASRPASMLDSVGAVDLQLDDNEIAELSAAVADHGE
ncbi:MAG TPA: aldo/keto reductase [Pseudolysinimonas sp.]|jgi:aryl-alcohol dehydrogenase-like predicted oxidoreductase